MGLLAKHPTNLIALKPTSTSFLENKNEKGKEKLVVMKVYDTPPKLLQRLKCKFESENNTRNWGMLLSLQHFRGKKGLLEFWDGE
jgi:hypothetical protein